MDLVIYGAQGVALGAYNSIRSLWPNRKVLSFLVTSRGMNAETLCNIPVRELAEFASDYPKEDRHSIQVLIATPENVMRDIEKRLEEYGFGNYVRLDSARWENMQKNAFIRDNKFTPLNAYLVGFSPAILHVYKVKFYKDKIQQNQNADPDYVTPIQVGASLTDVRVSDVIDSVGDSISDKNGNYSEITGLYWIWKNRIEKDYYGDDCYYGIAHYRRLLDISDDDLLRLQDNDIDAVLPYPMPYEPDIGEHHKRYLSDSEWRAVLQTLKDMQPEYASAFEGILKQEYFYNYNIIIAKSKVLDDYCSWLFPLLFGIEKLNDPEGIKPPNRYMGYVAEVLETLFFMYNKDKYRITHTGCRFST